LAGRGRGDRRHSAAEWLRQQMASLQCRARGPISRCWR
jgi:hypothetical protein